MDLTVGVETVYTELDLSKDAAGGIQLAGGKSCLYHLRGFGVGEVMVVIQYQSRYFCMLGGCGRKNSGGSDS